MNKKLLVSLLTMGMLVGCSVNTSSTVKNSSENPTTSSSKIESSKVSSETTDSSSVNSESSKESTTVHEHTYSTEWEKDETHHWHKATCEHTSEISDKEEHDWDEGVNTKFSSCEEAGEVTYTCTVCGQTRVEEQNKLGHSYGEVSYVWAEDNSTVTAKRVCENDATHVEEETVNTVATVTQAQACDADELTTYTATFVNEAFAQQVKENVKTKEATGHSYGEVTYTWAEDNSTVTAKRVCVYNTDHVEEETVNTVATVTQEQSCVKDELTTYTATFENEAFAQQVKENVVTKEKDPNVHNLGEFVKTETEHYKQCGDCEQFFERGEHKCETLDPWDQGRTCDVCGHSLETEKAMLAEFTFENGLENTGKDQDAYGALLSNDDADRGQEVVADAADYIHTSHVVGSTTYELGSSAIFSAHTKARPSFGVRGLDTGTGDFTISVKVYEPSDYVKSNYDTKNGQWYVFGMNTEENTGDNTFKIMLGKDSKSAGYVRTKVTLNGETKDLFQSTSGDQHGYYSPRKWAEYRVVKQDNVVTFTIVPSSLETQDKCSEWSVSFTLNSAEELMLTPEHVLGFGCNYGASRPGNDSYYDDVKVWNYAVDFAA
jgi:hypothetical protein